MDINALSIQVADTFALLSKASCMFFGNLFAAE